MKNVKRIILLSTISIIFFCSFLIPGANAQEWIYDGANTERIPSYSVYPSEWYVYEMPMFPLDILVAIEVTHGNITDYMMMGNGTCVWINGWAWNTTSGEKTLAATNGLVSYWNETVGYSSEVTPPFIIPVENDGKVSPSILGWVSVFLETDTLVDQNMQNLSIYNSIYSIAFWNESNNAYIHFNWTDVGILTGIESNIPDLVNASLYSQPAQLPPVFSFTTEHDTLVVNSTDTDLKVAITDADNDNDGVTDTDYLYRMFYGSTWTSWAENTTLIDFNLGSVPAGNYTVILEVKNMYGITQEQIEIQYAPPQEGDDGSPEIPGYSIILISIALFLGVSFLIHKNRKKM